MPVVEEYMQRKLPLTWDDYKHVILNWEDRVFHSGEAPAELPRFKIEKVSWSELGLHWAKREIRGFVHP